jgi:transmembrane sensor
MMASGELACEPGRRLEEASEWRLRIERDPSSAEAPEYLRWLADPLNASASEAVKHSCDSVRSVENTPELLELRRQALARLHQAGASRRRSRRMQLTATVGAVALVAVIGFAIYLAQCLPTYYKTDIGERRVVALPDGSRISMDSDTRVRVDYGKSARAVTLDRGRSRFDVAHDTSRPFTVTAGHQTVVAVGTSFDVERLQSSVLVTLIQGQVVIKDAELTPISLKAGEQLVVSSDVLHAVTATDPQVVRAWEAGRLLFRDEPLGDAVARVNRYTAHGIKIDPSIASIRISGVFNAGDIGSFVSAVTSYFAVQASTSRDNSILLQPRS